MRLLCSLPCGVTVQALFRRLADRIPSPMNTFLMPGQVPAQETAVAIALKDGLAVLTADPVTIPDLLGVVAKHRD
jgi:hypothetical protein